MASTDKECSWAVQAREVVKYYGNILALRGINLDLKKGEFLTIFGPNGAGKTTLLKILASILGPTSGTVKIFGSELRKNLASLRGQIGLLSHRSFLYSNLTAYENLNFYGRMYGVSKLKERIAEVIELVGLSDRVHSQVGTFSRGMQQRLALARAILHRPSLLLFDEPYTGLDPAAIKILAQLMMELHTGERTIVMTTHNLAHGLEVCDQVAIQAGGRIVYLQPRCQIDADSFESTYFSYTKEVAQWA